MKKLKLVLSKHAIEQARERGISINEIEETIRCGAKSLQNNKIISVYKHVKVVFKKLNNEYFIITVMIKYKP